MNLTIFEFICLKEDHERWILFTSVVWDDGHFFNIGKLFCMKNVEKSSSLAPWLNITYTQIPKDWVNQLLRVNFYHEKIMNFKHNFH